MKKLLTSMLTLALVLCCFTFVGCAKDNDPKPATIEQTLAICDQFIADMQAVQTKISAQDYVYPTTDAIRASKVVADTDKSSIGIQYSNYMDFDVEETLNEEFGDSFTVLDELFDATENGAVSTLEFLAGEYKAQKLSLDVVYSIEDEDSISYIKLTNNNLKVCLSYKMLNTDGYYGAEIILNLNSDNTWKSFEMKAAEEDGMVNYLYVEKSTDESRIFNQVIDGFIDGTDIGIGDYNEIAQKMMYVHFHNEPSDTIQTKALLYLRNLDIPSILDNFVTNNPVEIQISFD